MVLQLSVNHKTQKGAALLLYMLVLVLASSYTLLSKLNPAAKSYTREQVTSKTLSEAKQVLMGYALTYPENNAGFGPGYLPCPDRNNDGFINAGACASSTATTIGRFPWRSLGVREMIDSSGARLWYVLSDNYRNNPKINNFGGYMNSDNAGQLSLDGVGDIVALIIAPGEPVGDQNRDISEFDIPDEIVNYLEDENADIGGAFDVDFVTTDADDFNDKVVAITRQELMNMVEKRVLAEVEDRVIDYQNAYNAFPWLSPFSNPNTSTFKSTAATYAGHIPYHYSTDTAGASNRNPFSTNISVDWNNIMNATTAVINSFDVNLGIGLVTLSEACLNDINDCDEGGIFPEITTLLSDAEVDCTWTDKETVDCDSFSVSMTVAYVHNPVECPAGGTITRTYTITYPSFTGTFTTNNPTAVNSRTRNVSLSVLNPVFLPAQATAIQITDVFTGISYVPAWPGCGIGTNLTVATGTSTFDADTEGDISVNGIKYDIDIDEDEFPSWFVNNNWQDLIYLSYASGEPLPGDTTDTTPADSNPDNSCVTLGTQCLTVNIDGVAANNIRATVVSAGVDLTAGTARPNATLGDYFDDDNNDLDSMIDKKRVTTTYNDQTRIISTAP